RLPTVPSDPVARPAPRRFRGGALLLSIARELAASPHRSRPHALASQSPSRGELHTPAGRESASEASAGHCWKRARTGRPGTFLPVFVAGQKRLWIFGYERPVLQPFKEVLC